MPAAGKMAEINLEKENSYWLRNVILITVAQFFAQVAFCAAMTFMPFWFKDVAMIKDQGSLSMYVAIYNVAGNLSFCIFAPIWGVLGDRYGLNGAFCMIPATLVVYALVILLEGWIFAKKR